MVWLPEGEKFDDTFSRFDTMQSSELTEERSDKQTDRHHATAQSAIAP